MDKHDSEHAGKRPIMMSHTFLLCFVPDLPPVISMVAEARSKGGRIESKDDMVALMVRLPVR